MTQDELDRICHWVERMVDTPMADIAATRKGGSDVFHLFFDGHSNGQIIQALLRAEFAEDVTDDDNGTQRP